MKLNKNAKLIIGGLVIIALVGSGVWYYQDQQTREQKDEANKSQEEAKKREEELKKQLEELQKEEDAAKEEENKTGTIEGSLSYPSEGIPEDMKVCAVNIMTNKETCTSKQLKSSQYTNGTGYKLEVPAGTYNVYAWTSIMPDCKAYYSEAVTCGLESACTSHKPLSVKVTASKTTSKVDPADWYNE